jgi:hypothetical protein
MTQIDSTTNAAQSPDAAAADLVAGPDAGYRWKHLLMAVALIAGGLWFAYDGWVRWPAQNVRAAELERQKAAETDPTRLEALARELGQISKHTDLDILIQKILAFALPAAGLFWAGWTLRDTRGVYRMSGDVLQVPGHPPITFNDIRRIDKRKWDRKGIAYLHYEHGQRHGIVKLDDFAYDREPTDAMLDRIEKSLLGTPDGTTPSAGA